MDAGDNLERYLDDDDDDGNGGDDDQSHGEGRPKRDIGKTRLKTTKRDKTEKQEQT